MELSAWGDSATNSFLKVKMSFPLRNIVASCGYDIDAGVAESDGA
jgi:hypothetical protein